MCSVFLTKNISSQEVVDGIRQLINAAQALEMSEKVSLSFELCCVFLFIVPRRAFLFVILFFSAK